MEAPPQHGACFEDEEKEGGKEGLEACANIPRQQLRSELVVVQPSSNNVVSN